MNTTPQILTHSIRVPDPNLDHIPRDLYKSSLYEPSDDSFLFMEAIERDLNTIRVLFSMGSQNDLGLKPATQPNILEVGPGTGILSSYTAKLLSASPVLTTEKISNSDHINSNCNGICWGDDTNTTITQNYPTYSHCAQNFVPSITALDINPLAVRMTQETFNHNNDGTQAIAIESDLLTNLPQYLLQNVNLLIFNPPYVPSEDYEHENRSQNDMIMNAYAGGAKGRVILDKFIPYIPTLFLPQQQCPNAGPISTLAQTSPLTPFVFYCVFLWPPNDITNLNDEMNNSLYTFNQTRYNSHIIMARQCGLEALAIVRFIPNDIFLKLPKQLRVIHPEATEENMQAIFKPKLDPFIHNVNSTRSIQNPIATIDNQSDGDNSNDDSDNEEGFSLF